MRWTDGIKRWTGSVETPVTTMENSRGGSRAIMKATAAQFSKEEDILTVAS